MDKSKVKLLHSRYNPHLEAERYIASLTLNEGIRYFILIEPGLCYIAAPLKKRFPLAKLIALHAEKHAREGGIEMPDSQWHPETGISIQDFLEAEIEDSQAREIKLLEWRPAISVYGEAYRALIEEAAEFIKRVDASKRTLGVFGRFWFKNFFKNLDIIKKVLYPTHFSLPLLVTGAGPGLEDAIPLVREHKNKLCILASSSSVAALLNAGLKPDMIISTDGSKWAKLHLYESFRLKQLYCPIAAALSAALPSQCETLPLLLLSDGSLWQTLILEELKLPYIALPQRGTVSATALDMAFALTTGEIYIAGIDLENRDIRSHARPYSFDRFLEEKSGRTKPVYSETYKRSSLLKEGGAYDIYASWFKKQLAFYPKRLHPLGKNNHIFGKQESFSGENYDEKSSMENFDFKTLTLPPGEVNSQKALGVLQRALKDSAYSDILQKELAPLLLNGKTGTQGEELEDIILETIAIRREGKNG